MRLADSEAVLEMRQWGDCYGTIPPVMRMTSSIIRRINAAAGGREVQVGGVLINRLLH